MQKIIIKNFGAIQSAEIEIKKWLILIGEQASGKSTVAKLIYFFKSLKDDLFQNLYKNPSKNAANLHSDWIIVIRSVFYNFFGYTIHSPHFAIRFYYNLEKDKYLELTVDKNKKLLVVFSPLFFNESFKLAYEQNKKWLNNGFEIKNAATQLTHEQYRIQYVENLATLINELFEIKQTNSLFVIAGRNATVSYSELFEKYLFADVQRRLEDNRKKTLVRKEQTIDELLMLKFIEQVVKMKAIFKKFGDFDVLIDQIPKNKVATAPLQIVKNRIQTILKGKYSIHNGDEKIILNNDTKDKIRLSNASSGQQEVIRILQDIFITILDNETVLRILEEPEAHLFPIAQKQLIELLALMMNQSIDNQLIITTHSPYILTVFNNLLFAKRVVDKNALVSKDVERVIAKDFWLNLDDFSAYTLGSYSDDENWKYCESIMDEETKLIQQNYLDEVSEMLGSDFQALYAIHSKTFMRK
jgi:predicted ATP-dependent endonuclease of OLD family